MDDFFSTIRASTPKVTGDDFFSSVKASGIQPEVVQSSEPIDNSSITIPNDNITDVEDVSTEAPDRVGASISPIDNDINTRIDNRAKAAERERIANEIVIPGTLSSIKRRKPEDISDEELYNKYEITLASAYNNPDENLRIKQEIVNREYDEAFRDRVNEPRLNIEAIYNHFNLPQEIGAIAGNKEARAVLDKELSLIKDKTIQELSAAGINAYFKKDGYLYAVNDLNQEQRIEEPSAAKMIWAEKFAMAGAISGGITGSNVGSRAGVYGAIAGGIVGSAAGAFAGSYADAFVANLDMIYKAEQEVLLAKAIDSAEAGAILDLGFTATAPLVMKAGSKVLSNATDIWQAFTSSNPDGAKRAILKATNSTEEEAIQAVKDFETITGTKMTGSEAQNWLEALVNRQGGESLINVSKDFDKSGAIQNIVTSAANRANAVLDSVVEVAGNDTVVALRKELDELVKLGKTDEAWLKRVEIKNNSTLTEVEDALDAYTKEVKTNYGLVKNYISKDMEGYSFNINDIAIEPIKESKITAGAIADETIRNRWLSKIEDIEYHLTKPPTFDNLLDLYSKVNQLGRDARKAKAIDYETLNNIKANITKEIDFATTEFLGKDKAKTWKDAWGQINKDYSAMKYMEEGVLHKALLKKGLSGEDVSRIFKKYADAEDDTFNIVMSKLPKNVQTMVEGNVFKTLVESRTSGRDNLNIIDFPTLSKDLNNINFNDPKIQKAAEHIHKMAQVFRNDINLARVSGMITPDRFQSYLTTDPVVRAKFWFSSQVFNQISRVLPGEKADNFMAYTQLSKVFQNPTNKKAIDLVTASVKDRRFMKDLFNSEEFKTMMSDYTSTRLQLEDSIGRGNIPPNLVQIYSGNGKVFKGQGTSITTPVDEALLYASQRGTVGSNASDVQMHDKSSDIFTEYLFNLSQGSTKVQDSNRIQDIAEQAINSKRFDNVVRDTRTKIANQTYAKAKETLKAVQEREVQQLVKYINSSTGVQVPSDGMAQLRKIVLLRYKEIENGL